MGRERRRRGGGREWEGGGEGERGGEGRGGWREKGRRGEGEREEGGEGGREWEGRKGGGDVSALIKVPPLSHVGSAALVCTWSKPPVEVMYPGGWFDSVF